MLGGASVVRLALFSFKGVKRNLCTLLSQIGIANFCKIALKKAVQVFPIENCIRTDKLMLIDLDKITNRLCVISDYKTGISVSVALGDLRMFQACNWL